MAKVTLASGGFAYGYACSLDNRVRVIVRKEAPGQPKTTQIQVGDQVFARGDWEGAAQALATLGPGRL